MTGRSDCDQRRILLIEDHPADARMVEIELADAQAAAAADAGDFALIHVSRLEAALERLSRERFAVVLLDLRLPDSELLSTLGRVCSAAPESPVVVLTGIDDDDLALAAIQRGAQDYIYKDRLDGRLLLRTIRQAIQRKRIGLELVRHAREVEAARESVERQAEALRGRADQLDRANRDLNDFTYIVAHDLKEPLRGIRGYSELLLEDYCDKVDAGGRRRLAALVEMCDCLQESIESLLTYCHVGRDRPQEEQVDVDSVARQVIKMLSPAIEQRRGRVRILNRLPSVAGNANLIGMVLGNLISNGLKFNESQNPAVEIGSRGGEPATLFVRDNGIGIAQRHYDAIFSIFRRLHGRRQYEGSGVGLTIVRKVVEAHGGRVWLESEPGRGATFFFTLAPAPAPPSQSPHWDRSLQVSQSAAS
jgi:signal transduction histidine kinase